MRIAFLLLFLPFFLLGQDNQPYFAARAQTTDAPTDLGGDVYRMTLVITDETAVYDGLDILDDSTFFYICPSTVMGEDINVFPIINIVSAFAGQVTVDVRDVASAGQPQAGSNAICEHSPQYMFSYVSGAGDPLNQAISDYNLKQIDSEVAGTYNRVWAIAESPDTTTITEPIEGDVAYISPDSVWFRDSLAWLLHSGGSTEVADGVTILGDGTGGDPFRVDTTLLATRYYADSLRQVVYDSLGIVSLYANMPLNVNIPACDDNISVIISGIVHDPEIIAGSSITGDITVTGVAGMAVTYIQEEDGYAYFEATGFLTDGVYAPTVEYVPAGLIVEGLFNVNEQPCYTDTLTNYPDRTELADSTAAIRADFPFSTTSNELEIDDGELKLAQQGAETADVMSWLGSSWGPQLKIEADTSFYVCNDTCQFSTWNGAFEAATAIKRPVQNYLIKLIAVRNGDGSHFEFSDGLYVRGGDYNHIELSSTDTVEYTGTGVAFQCVDGGCFSVNTLRLVGSGTGTGLRADYASVNWREIRIYGGFSTGVSPVRSIGNIRFDTIANCTTGLLSSLSAAMYIRGGRIIDCPTGIFSVGASHLIQTVTITGATVGIKAVQGSCLGLLGGSLSSVQIGENSGGLNGGSLVYVMSGTAPTANVPINRMTDNGGVFITGQPYNFQQSTTAGAPAASSTAKFYVNTDKADGEGELQISDGSSTWYPIIAASSTPDDGETLRYNGLTGRLDPISPYQSGSGSPVSAVMPDYIGQEYLDTSGNNWWKAHGLTDTDWTQLTN